MKEVGWISSLLALAFALGASAKAADPVSPISGKMSGATTQPTDTKELVPASNERLGEVQKRLRSVQSLEADFTEDKNLAVLRHTLKLTGRFALQSPDKVIWIVRTPVAYAIRVQGEEVTQWDQDTNKVQKINLHGDPTFKAISEQLQAWFMGNYQALEQSYDAYIVSEKPFSLRFVPKGGTMVVKLIKYIEITFSADGMTIDKMLIREASGDTTTLNISNSRINQPLKKETWEIPPK